MDEMDEMDVWLRYACTFKGRCYAMYAMLNEDEGRFVERGDWWVGWDFLLG